MKSSELTAKSSKPLISIVMAAYNEERSIHRAIESIREQTFSEWELIIVDDGSQDGTAEIIETYANKDSRIHLISNKTNLGLPSSLNRGIKSAQADLIARADADDLNLPERLAKQFEYMQTHPAIDVLGTGAYLLGANGERVSDVSLPATHRELKEQSFMKTIFFHPSVIFRKRFFVKTGGYDPTYIRAQDKELWLCGLRFGCQYANLAEPLVEYHTNGYIRSWKSTMNRTISSMRMAKIYKIKGGYLNIFKSLVISTMIKLCLYTPKSIK